MNAGRSIRVSAPGRVCLFGEHQDYLGLPVIPCAISLRISVRGTHRSDRLARVDLPDISAKEEFSLAGPLAYSAERDYLRSSVNVLRRIGFTWSRGFDARVHGTIPINSGTSSSSALIVAWVNLLAQMSDERRLLDPETIARHAHAAEVLEFGEPGGMMDHFSTSVGGTMFLEFTPAVRVERLGAVLAPIVLGDSREPKDTKGILARVKDRVIASTKRLEAEGSGFSLHRTAVADIERYTRTLAEEERALLRGTIRNRDITLQAREALVAPEPDDQRIGDLLNEHQTVLRDVLRISTPKIDRMLDAACDAGALGGKINGSGGGGCMFAYAPQHAHAVAEAIERAGGKAFIVRADEGTRNDKDEESE